MNTFDPIYVTNWSFTTWPEPGLCSAMFIRKTLHIDLHLETTVTAIEQSCMLFMNYFDLIGNKFPVIEL